MRATSGYYERAAAEQPSTKTERNRSVESNTSEIDFDGLVLVVTARVFSEGSLEGPRRWTASGEERDREGAGYTGEDRGWQSGGCRNGSLNFSNN